MHLIITLLWVKSTFAVVIILFALVMVFIWACRCLWIFARVGRRFWVITTRWLGGITLLTCFTTLLQHCHFVYTSQHLLNTCIIKHLQLLCHMTIRKANNKPMYNFIWSSLSSNRTSLHTISKLLCCFILFLRQGIKGDTFWHSRSAKTLKQHLW